MFVDFLSRALSDTNKVSGVSIGQHHHIDYSHSRVVDWRNSDWVKWFTGCLFTIIVCNHTFIWSLLKARLFLKHTSRSVCTSTDDDVCMMLSSVLGEGFSDTVVVVETFVTPGVVCIPGIFLPLPLPLIILLILVTVTCRGVQVILGSLSVLVIHRNSSGSDFRAEESTGSFCRRRTG